MALGAGGPGVVRMDVIWTMRSTDTASRDLDGFDARFNVSYVEPDSRFIVSDIQTLPDWEVTDATSGIGSPFSESLFLSVADPTFQGISGNGTQFSTVIASILLQVDGNVAGTEISFRHDSYQDPVPAAYDGPLDWQLRWQEEVNGPLQFDIGVGNPGDNDNWNGPFHGYEPYQPLTIPEPSGLMLLAFGVVSAWRLSRHNPNH